MRYPRFTRLAQNDLFEISDFISQDNPDAAVSVVEAIEETAIQAMTYPKIGRLVDSNHYTELRTLPCGDFPIYQLFYLQLKSELIVVRVLHGARDIPRLLND